MSKVPRRQHGPGNLPEHRMTSYALADARLKGHLGNLVDIEPKAPENAADAELDVGESMLELPAGNHRARTSWDPADLA
jgi:hypothetical protein